MKKELLKSTCRATESVKGILVLIYKLCTVIHGRRYCSSTKEKSAALGGTKTQGQGDKTFYVYEFIIITPCIIM
jgi:hypothetical protein